MDDLVSRRDFVAGLAASLALLFAPLDRFFARLRALFFRVREATEQEIAISYETLTAIFKKYWPQQMLHEFFYRDRPMYALIPRRA